MLRKEGRLDDGELAQIREHPKIGVRILLGLAALREAIPYVLYHHERWDGDGYPSGKAGEEIPIEARVLAIADAFDAMTSDRPYRTALSRDEALAEVERCAGTQFDPDDRARLPRALRRGRAAGRGRLLDQLRLRPADDLVGELARPRVAAEVGGAHAGSDRLEARLADRASPPRRPPAA